MLVSVGTAIYLFVFVLLFVISQNNVRSSKGVYDDMLARLTPVSLRKYQFAKKRKNSAAT